MFNKKQNILLLMLCCLTFLLSGCIKGNVNLTINDNGTADTEFLIVGVPILQEQINLIKSDFEKKNMKVIDYAEENMTGFKATQHYEDPTSLTNIPFYRSNEGINEGIKIHHSWYYDDYTFDLFLPGNNDKSLSKEENDMQLAMLSQVKFHFILNLPIKSDTNNATNLANNGKTLSWDLSLVNDNHMQAKVKVFNKVHILITAFLALILIFVFLISYYKVHNNKNEKVLFWQALHFTAITLLILLVIISIYSISFI